MRVPSEAELIEMERRFDFLLEIAEEMRDSAKVARMGGNTGRACDLETDAKILEVTREQAHELVELAREGAWVVQDAR